MKIKDKFTELKTLHQGANHIHLRWRPCTRAIVHALACGGADVIERALESAHAVAYVKKAAESGELGDLVVINLSGRGDKDVYSVAKREGF